MEFNIGILSWDKSMWKFVHLHGRFFDVCFVIFLSVCVCVGESVSVTMLMYAHTVEISPPFPHTLSKNLRALLAEFDPKCLKLSFWNVIWGRKGVSLPFSSGFSKPKGTIHGF